MNRYVYPTFPKIPTSCDSVEWGWIDPMFKMITYTKVSPYYSHRETFGKNASLLEIFQQGYIRYAIGANGEAMFNALRLNEVRRRISRFLAGRPDIKGPIYFDWGGGKVFDEIESLDLNEVANYLTC